MKIYLAGSCSSENRTVMMDIVKFLRHKGYEVLAPFEYKVENEWDMSQEDWANDVFQHDCALINDADLVLIISPGRISTAGTNWEQGYAYGLGKKICVVQIGHEPTSLMTYGGCDYFINFEDTQLFKFELILEHIKHGGYVKFCDGVLT